MAVVLHLLERKSVDFSSFTQSNVTEARRQLAIGLSRSKRSNGGVVDVRKAFRNCFPLLAIVDRSVEAEVETLLPVLESSRTNDTRVMELKTKSTLELELEIGTGTTATTTTLTAATLTTTAPTLKTTVAKAEVEVEVVNLTGMEETKVQPGKAPAPDSDNNSDVNDKLVLMDGEVDVDAPDDSVSALSNDTMFYDVMHEANLECFPTLEAVNPIVEAYESRTGNALWIIRSINDQFRVYECREHVGCPFQIRISRRKFDGNFVVSKMKTQHSDVLRDPKAKDGRQWKKRRYTKLNNLLIQVLKTKSGHPTPADVIKTAANESGLILTYMTAYRAIASDAGAGCQLSVRSFQQMVPYLEEMKKCNPMSVNGCTKSTTNELVDVFLFPHFMNDALKFVRPVVSLDAAHLRSEWLGTLYIASV